MLNDVSVFGRVKTRYLECSFYFINFVHAEGTRRISALLRHPGTYCENKIRRKPKSDGFFFSALGLL